jgi:hypothetical protein
MEIVDHPPEAPVETVVRLQMLDDQTGIVRIYYRDVETGRIIAKYGLNRDGTWTHLMEAEPATREMVLTPEF